MNENETVFTEDELDENIQQELMSSLMEDKRHYADYLLQKVAECDKELIKLEDYCNKHIQQVTEYLTKEMGKITGKQMYFKSQLRDISEELIPSNKSSVKLINGSIGFRKQAPKFTIDNDLLLNWATTNGQEFVKSEPKVMWGELKKQCIIENGMALLHGEIVAGVQVQEQEPSFYVKANAND